LDPGRDHAGTDCCYCVLLIQAVPLFTAMQAKLDKLNLILDENLTGVRVIRAFNRIKHEEERFDKANLEVTNLAIKVNQLVQR